MSKRSSIATPNSKKEVIILVLVTLYLHAFISNCFTKKSKI